MKSWLLWSVLALISWGFWGLFPKFATDYVSPRSALFWEILGGGIASTCWIVTQRGWPEVEPRGILFGAMAGMLALIGAWCYTQACAYGNISRVVTVTALYPVITVLDRKSTRLNSSHLGISYAVFCL